MNVEVVHGNGPKLRHQGLEGAIKRLLTLVDTVRLAVEPGVTGEKGQKCAGIGCPRGTGVGGSPRHGATCLAGGPEAPASPAAFRDPIPLSSGYVVRAFATHPIRSLVSPSLRLRAVLRLSVQVSDA